jgi:hypothetical protein
MLRRDAGCGYGAQEFTSAEPESPNIWLARAGIRNDSAGKKGGLIASPPFFFADFLADSLLFSWLRNVMRGCYFDLERI